MGDEWHGLISDRVTLCQMNLSTTTAKETGLWALALDKALLPLCKGMYVLTLLTKLLLWWKGKYECLCNGEGAGSSVRFDVKVFNMCYTPTWKVQNSPVSNKARVSVQFSAFLCIPQILLHQGGWMDVSPGSLHLFSAYRELKLVLVITIFFAVPTTWNRTMHVASCLVYL